MNRKWLATSVAGALLLGLAPRGHAQDVANGTAQQAPTKTDVQQSGASGGNPAPTPRARTLAGVDVTATSVGYAAQPHYEAKKVELGPLGDQAIRVTPFSVTVVPEDLIANQQAKTVNDILRNLPSVEIRDQQGLEVSRPQSRGFQGTIVQNTRMDGLNVIGTTAIPGENLSNIEVLNGLAGSLYGPATPAGVFNYVLKRPTDEPLLRFIESFDSQSTFTEQLDAGGRFGPDDKFGYRANIVHGNGEGYVDGSNTDRTLLSLALDYHFDDQTVLETNFSHYETAITGLPGSIVYDSGRSTVLPRAVDPTTQGLGQPGAGTDLMTNTGLIKLKHVFDNGWSLEVGGLYQDALRHLLGITNTFTDNSGDYTVTKNFNAVPRFTIASNLAQLNGHVDLFGMRNDISIGTNGFDNGQYSYRNSIAVTLGKGNLSHPVVFTDIPGVPDNGGMYKSGDLVEQSLVFGDTIHFNDQWAVQGVLNSSYINAKSYNKNGQVTSADSRNGVFSPTVSVLYNPTSRLFVYATYANSVEQGETAPAGTANANEFLAPYHDEEYELGAKYAVTDHFLLSVAGFRMSRPLADTDAATNLFAVVGTQKNTGAEFFAQGDLTHQLSLFGGVTYINARLLNTGNPATNGGLVVGVPHVKNDFSVDYHPDFARGFALTGTAHFESRRAATNINNTYAPSYATFDVGARYATHFLSYFATFRLQVINVANRFYYSSVADGNIVGSPGANTAYFGAPRTVLASAEVDL
jgi:iron complex outermembrane receptor protein